MGAIIACRERDSSRNVLAVSSTFAESCRFSPWQRGTAGALQRSKEVVHMRVSWSRAIVVGAVVLTFCASRAAAQPSAWNIDVGTGVAATTGDTGSRLTNGWDFNLGAEYSANEWVGVRGDFRYDGLGVSDQVTQKLQVPNGSGNARVISLTVGPVFRFPIAGRVQGYALGGLGWYRRTIEFLQPTLAAVDIVDPWWGYLGTAIVPANQIIGSTSNNAFGGNIGGGVSVPLGGSGASVFGEVRYHRANTDATPTSMVPVTFGIRFTGAPNRP